MLFNSISFLLFFPVVLLLYYLLPGRFKNVLLCVASFYFYMSCHPQYGILLLITVLVTYFAGIFIETKSKLKWIFTSGVLYNVLILLFYKYFNFLSENATALFQVIGMHINRHDLTIVLPIGISFFTFKAITFY